MTITYVYGKNLYVNLTNRCPNACDFCLRTTGDHVGDSGSLWLEREPTKEEILTELENGIYLIMSSWYTAALENLLIDWKISNGFLQKCVK